MEDDQEQLPAIPDEDATRQEVLSFQGDALAAAMGASGNIYVTIPSLCAAFGLVQRGQMIRIMRTSTLAKGVRRMSIETSGGLQKVNCLRIDKVPLWIAGMETVRIKPALRGKIEEYQETLAPFAMQVFMRVMGIQGTPASATDPRIAGMADQFQELLSVALDIRSHMEAFAAMPGQIDTITLQLDQAVDLLESLAGDNAETHQAIEKIKEKTAGLTPAQARQIQEQISNMVAVTARKPYAMKHATIYGRIRHRFRVPSYINVPDSRFQELSQFLRDELTRASDGDVPAQGELF